MQHFIHNVHSGRFLALPLECGKCNTVHYPIGYYTQELLPQPAILEPEKAAPTRDKECEQRLCKTGSDWSESFGKRWKLEAGYYQH